MIDTATTLVTQFPHAIVAGLLVSATCAVLGVFVILKRVVFIGVTLSEVAACGIAAAYLLGVPPFLGAMGLTLGTVGILAYPFESRRIPRDAVLGVLFVFAGAASVLLVAHSGLGLLEVRALLYGDLILASSGDVRVIVAILVPAGLVFLAVLRPVLNAFLDREAARVLGGHPACWEGVFFVILGATIAAASGIAGALLVFCYIVVAPATALLLTRQFAWVLGAAALCGMTATLAGLLLSLHADVPTNQTIAAVACLLFVAAAVCAALRRGWQRMSDTEAPRAAR